MGMLELFKWTPFVLAFLLNMGNESSASFTPVDNYLLACGSSRNIVFQGRIFVPDSDYKADKSFTVCSNSSLPFPVHESARVFWSRSSYTFRIEKQGWHWIRLYFYPIPNLNQNLSSASIAVVADSFVLLNNFTFMKYEGSHLFKEYAINITSPTFSITFIPSSNSVVFVNAIEVVSIPDELFPHQAMALNSSSPFDISGLALEIIYRLNVGGDSLNIQNDNLGRNWEDDEKYLSSNSSSALNISVNPLTISYPSSITPETAPAWVYATAKAMADAQRSPNLSWSFPINPNFSYVVRVHFCDIVSKSLYTFIFDLFINGNIAIERLDLSSIIGNLSVPYYKDFVVIPRANTLTVSVTPVTPYEFSGTKNAIMNGLEIMKIRNGKSDCILPNSSPKNGKSDCVLPNSSTTNGKVDNILPNSSPRNGKSAIIVGSSVSAAAFLVLIGITLSYITIYGSKSSSVATLKSCRLFTFQEIQDAANNFDQSLLLGEGGFGKVYKGKIENGKKVAIKVANHKSRQGLHEFQNEIELLSKLSHQNLVSLIGYCNEGSRMILVYEYMANGSFSSHLHGTNLVPLSWKRRLEICIGAAKGLHYLHTGAHQSIIHRDVKTANILLDKNFVPKVADFGISRKGPPLDKSHVTTTVKGSFGYLDPEYFRTKFLTEKSDVYSFGVVLMEVICGKSALDNARPTEEINLARWASSCQEGGTFHQIIEPNLTGKVNLDSLNKVCDLAWKCLEEHRANRPPMGYVLCQLEDALHLELASPTWRVSMDSVTAVDAEDGIKDDNEQVAS